MGEFAIMNNGPFHFIVSAIALVIFAVALMTSDKAMKARLKTGLMVVFALQIISGCMVWFKVDQIGWEIVTKSLGGLVLMWLLVKLIDQPSNRTYWILAVLIAIVGLTLAFFFI